MEVPAEGSGKRPRGRLANIGHFHEEAGLENFICIIFQQIIDMLQIPSIFFNSFGPILWKITILTNTGCSWTITSKYDGGKAIIDQGWAPFAISHDPRVGYFSSFRRDAPGIYQVVIFDYTCTEVMTRCPDH
jgi:hypothetical protein